MLAAAAGAKQASHSSDAMRRLLSSMTYLAALGFDLAALDFAHLRPLRGLAMLADELTDATLR